MPRRLPRIPLPPFTVAHLPAFTARCGHSVIGRMTRHGLPAANTPAGMSRVTTLPAPITVPDPIVTPGQMIPPPPTYTSDPIATGLPNSCLRRRSAFIGWVAV